MIRLLIFGPTGSMGRLITRLALEDQDIDVVASCDVEQIGQSLEQLVGSRDPKGVIINDSRYLEELIKKINPEIAVDFTTADATEENIPICIENGIKCVIGTTGLSDMFRKAIENLVYEMKVPVVISTNMATGVNILFQVASLLAQYLPDWDIEIIEAHHHRKRDSPSGSSITLGQKISEGLGIEFTNIVKYGRDRGPNKRKVGAKNEIGIHAVRAGDIVGDHTILYSGTGERIELKHQAHSRECFASGAIRAIKFIAQVQEPAVYTTNEVLKQ